MCTFSCMNHWWNKTIFVGVARFQPQVTEGWPSKQVFFVPTRQFVAIYKYVHNDNYLFGQWKSTLSCFVSFFL